MEHRDTLGAAVMEKKHTLPPSNMAPGGLEDQIPGGTPCEVPWWERGQPSDPRFFFVLFLSSFFFNRRIKPSESYGASGSFGGLPYSFHGVQSSVRSWGRTKCCYLSLRHVLKATFLWFYFFALLWEPEKETKPTKSPPRELAMTGFVPPFWKKQLGSTRVVSPASTTQLPWAWPGRPPAFHGPNPPNAPDGFVKALCGQKK